MPKLWARELYVPFVESQLWTLSIARISWGFSIADELAHCFLYSIFANSEYSRCGDFNLLRARSLKGNRHVANTGLAPAAWSRCRSAIRARVSENLAATFLYRYKYISQHCLLPSFSAFFQFFPACINLSFLLLIPPKIGLIIQAEITIFYS